MSKRKKQGEKIEIIQERCGALNELIFVLMLQLACSKNYGKVLSEGLAELFLGKLLFVQYNDTSPIERHETVVSDENPQVDPDQELQVISLN